MAIQIKKTKAKNSYPALSIYMGLPKIGKSTAMSKVPKSLILDLEGGRGYQGLEVDALVEIHDLKDLKDAVDYFFSDENKEYDVLVIDHLKAVSQMFSDFVKNKHGVTFVEEMDYGRGSYELNTLLGDWMDKLISRIAKRKKRVFLVAHAIDKNSQIRLDVNGKNENMVLSKVDAVGYIDRDENNTTTIRFSAGRGVEFGSRNKNLAAYSGELDWAKLFEIAEK